MICPYQNYLFDLDGTLADSAPVIMNSLKQALAENKIGVDEHLINSDLMGPPLAEIIAKLNSGFSEEAIGKIVADFRRLHDANPVKGVVLYDGIKDVLQKLAEQNKNCFVVTNKPIFPTLRILETFGIQKYFTEIYTPDMITEKNLSKAEMIELLLRKHALPPKETLMIGDSLGDIAAGHKNQCRTFAVLWGYGKEKEKMKELAEYFGNKPKDILEIKEA